MVEEDEEGEWPSLPVKGSSQGRGHLETALHVSTQKSPSMWTDLSIQAPQFQNYTLEQPLKPYLQ